jgi:MFS transporter, DHA1 family, multidrug resistance protein
MDSRKFSLDPFTRKVLIWMCVLIAVNQLSFSANIPIIAQYAESFGVSMTAIGFTFAIYGLARLLLSIPAGASADSWGRKNALAIGGVLSAVSGVGCAVAPNFELFLLARFVGGAGAAFVLTGGQIVLADIAGPHNRGRLMGVYQGVFLMTAGLGAIPGGWLATNYGIASPFWATAILAASVTVIALVFVPETRPLANVQSEAESSANPLNFRQQLGMLSRNEGLMLIGMIGLMAAFARTGGLFNVIPLMAENEIGLNPTQIGVGLGMISIVSLVFVWPSGVLSDSLGRKPILVPATLFSGAGFLIFVWAHDFTMFLVACLIWACAGGFAGGAPAAYAADVAPAGMTASAMGLYRALMDVGYVAGPLAIGFMADLWGVRTALVITAGLTLGTAIVFAIRAPDTHSGRRAVAEAKPTP